ncbi:MAG: ABC transporter ATP-binding protein [Gammaproteobacteria bacterium]|nr:ABC transporter ATP-binding protein [Gammaproteobacteria bacterium]
MTTNYGFGTTLPMDFEHAIDVVTEALKQEGFGVLTDIDVQSTLKQKLDEDMPPYRILGACNPPLAHQALAAEPSIGLLLPCNVVVRQDDDGTVHVEFMDPTAVLDLVDNPTVHALARQVRQRLDRVRAAVAT